MLVLSRNKNQSIVLPELGLIIQVLRVSGNTVRLGIEAPDSVRIMRSELTPIVGEFQTHEPNSSRGLGSAASELQGNS